ncbi:MAG: sugar transferase [Chitinophagaceae bacterium]|nr:sugar transferase [Chitinophagaceae bacterium]
MINKSMYNFIKRIIDILIATIALILLSPILIPSIIILRLPVATRFLFSERVGYKNRLFNIWKFATVKNSPNIGTEEITLRNLIPG